MSDQLAVVQSELEEAHQVIQAMLADSDLMKTIVDLADLCVAALRRGNKVLLAGNGGSAADAQHIAGEFVSRFYYDRPGLASIALTTDTSVLTAIGNDYGYERLFSRQVQALGVPGDVFIGITTSGRSPNIIKAIAQAKTQGITSILLTGQRADIDLSADVIVRAPSTATPRIQEAHIKIGHIMCGLVEAAMFPQSEL